MSNYTKKFGAILNIFATLRKLLAQKLRVLCIKNKIPGKGFFSVLRTKPPKRSIKRLCCSFVQQLFFRS